MHVTQIELKSLHTGNYYYYLHLIILFPCEIHISESVFIFISFFKTLEYVFEQLYTLLLSTLMPSASAMHVLLLLITNCPLAKVFSRLIVSMVNKINYYCCFA